MPDRYTHGHHDSVLRSHRWRTVENSAAYAIPVLVPGARVLDVGCGPGTITADIAERVAPGEVVAVDLAGDVLAEAAEHARARGAGNVRFEQHDVYRLPYDDGAFDVVHAHQTLQHLRDPVRALREMRRVCRPDGAVAARDGGAPGRHRAVAEPGHNLKEAPPRQLVQVAHAETVVFPFLVEHRAETLPHAPALGIRRPSVVVRHRRTTTTRGTSAPSTATRWASKRSMASRPHSGRSTRPAADAPRPRGRRPRRRGASGARTRRDQARASAGYDVPSVPRPRRSSVLPLRGLRRPTPGHDGRAHVWCAARSSSDRAAARSLGSGAS